MFGTKNKVYTNRQFNISLIIQAITNYCTENKIPFFSQLEFNKGLLIRKLEGCAREIASRNSSLILKPEHGKNSISSLHGNSIFKKCLVEQRGAEHFKNLPEDFRKHFAAITRSERLEAKLTPEQYWDTKPKQSEAHLADWNREQQQNQKCCIQ